MALANSIVGQRMERRVSIGRVPVAVSTSNPVHDAAVEDLFGHCEPTTDRPRIEIVDADHVDLPERPADISGNDTELWLADDGVATRHGYGVAARRTGERIAVVGDGRPDPVRAYRMAVQLPLIDALSLHDRHVLHAATVERGGGAILALGGSGDGKSTFAYAAGRAGWNVVADDLAVLVADGESVTVAGFPKPVRVPHDVLGGPPREATPMPGDQRRRWSLPPANGAGGPFRVVAVVYVGHGDQGPAAAHVSASPARVRDLVTAHPLTILPRVMRGFFPIAGRLARLPTFRYAHDPDPDRRLVDVARFLDDVMTLGSVAPSQ
jgi:hypothetical protein